MVVDSVDGFVSVVVIIMVLLALVSVVVPLAVVGWCGAAVVLNVSVVMVVVVSSTVAVDTVLSGCEVVAETVTVLVMDPLTGA